MIAAIIEFGRFLWSISWSTGGLSAVACVLAVIGLLVASRVLAVLPEWSRTVLILIAVGAGMHTIGYGSGRHDERGFYKGRINREIASSILKGDAAREKALREFDASNDMPDDGFRRD